MGHVIDCRSDVTDLRCKHPGVFGGFHKLRLVIDSPPARVGMGIEGLDLPPLHERQKREEAAKCLATKLASIRQLPGFEGFQLPPRSEELVSIAPEGSIVMFNSTEIRSDAIIVTGSSIKALALPDLDYLSVKERMSQVAKLAKGTRQTYASRNQQMQELLLWLWNTAVEPVMNVLGLDSVPGDRQLPRIWWIGVGLLAMAPFHAAGDHSRRSTRNTISRAISAYTPTIKALSYARQRDLELPTNSDFRLLLVSMPKTLGQSDLINARKEVEGIMTLADGGTQARTTHLNHPSPSQVIQQLPSYHAVHFACHGVSDAENPSNSSLLLQNDNDLEAIGRLTVGDISSINLKNAQIAYLSACSTAENASTILTDESIYIASGFQLAGFSHVLATQWVSNDEVCRQVAGDFYKSLFDGKSVGGQGGHRKVSESFHNAVKKLRDENRNQPIKWASFIHTGA